MDRGDRWTHSVGALVKESEWESNVYESNEGRGARSAMVRSREDARFVVHDAGYTCVRGAHKGRGGSFVNTLCFLRRHMFLTWGIAWAAPRSKSQN